MRLLNNGSAERCKDNYCGPRAIIRKTNGQEFPILTLPFMAFGNGESGNYFGGLGMGSPQEQSERKEDGTHIDGDPNTQDEKVIEKPFTDTELDAIRDQIVKIVSTGRCGEFLTRLLNNAGAGDDPPVHKNILDLFNAVRKQGGFTSATLIDRQGATRGYSSVKGAVGAPGGAKVLLSSTSDVYSPATRILYHAYNALSELTHVAGTQVSNYVEGAFSDFNLAYEAHQLANSMGHGVKNLNLDPPKVDPYNDTNGKWSDYYHGIVKLFCKRDPPQ